MLSRLVMKFTIIYLMLLSVFAYDVDVPTKQSELQKELVDKYTQQARGLSQKATASVLKAFDSEEFRQEIAELPFANASSKYILDLFRQTIRLTTVVHNIPSMSTTVIDYNVTIIFKSQYLYNYWDALALGITRLDESVASVQDSVEVELFGFPPFSRPLHPTLQEAQQRSIYGALNIWQLSSGNILFGGVSLVFSRSYLRPLTIISPVDTGFWKRCCNMSSSQCPKGLVNCEAWDTTLGTYDYLDHLILPSCGYWNYTLGTLFKRLFAPDKYNVTYSLALAYWELELVGNVLFQQEGLHFVIATFTDSFGTTQGEMLQQWCMKLGIPLIWALGPNIATNSSVPPTLSFGMRLMLLDPLVGGIKNITALPKWKTLFSDVWKVVNETLVISKTLPPSLWSDFWNILYSELPASFRVHFLLANQCADTDRCLGTNDNKDCVCT